MKSVSRALEEAAIHSDFDDIDGDSEVAVLCMGASQDPDDISGYNEEKHQLRRRAGIIGLPDILKDVKTFSSMIEHMKDVDPPTEVVGADGGKMTAPYFLREFKKLLHAPNNQNKTVFILYYAGHGSQRMNGAFCMERSTFVSLKDLVDVWKARPGRKRFQKLIIVADSCFSGALIDVLKSYKKAERDTLGIGIQAACQNMEFSEGGVFTEVFTHKQLYNEKFQWARLAFLHGCSVDEIQHPTFFTTWGTDNIETKKGFSFKFFKRPGVGVPHVDSNSGSDRDRDFEDDDSNSDSAN